MSGFLFESVKKRPCISVSLDNLSISAVTELHLFFCKCQHFVDFSDDFSNLVVILKNQIFLPYNRRNLKHIPFKYFKEVPFPVSDLFNISLSAGCFSCVSLLGLC